MLYLLKLFIKIIISQQIANPHIVYYSFSPIRHTIFNYKIEILRFRKQLACQSKLIPHIEATGGTADRQLWADSSGTEVLTVNLLLFSPVNARGRRSVNTGCFLHLANLCPCKLTLFHVPSLLRASLLLASLAALLSRVARELLLRRVIFITAAVSGRRLHLIKHFKSRNKIYYCN